MPALPFPDSAAMTFRHSLAALAAVLLVAAPYAEEAKPVDNTPRLAYGQMLKHGDKLVFTPCRDRSYAMLEDVTADRVVTRALNSVGLDAGKKLYVELLAVAEGGAIRASGINQARTEGRCQQPGGNEESWRAAGNEPGWLLAVGNEFIVVKRLGKPDLRLPFSPPKTEGALTRFEVAAEGSRLAATFEKKLCHDTMADSVFGWTATLSLDGETLKGCAWQR
jgi:putative lipoprotein